MKKKFNYQYVLKNQKILFLIHLCKNLSNLDWYIDNLNFKFKTFITFYSFGMNRWNIMGSNSGCSKNAG